MTERLTLNLSAPPPIPEAGIAAAEAVLRAGWTHRYGETMGDASEAAMLEAEFAAHLGARFCVAVNSCGSAMFLALLCAGVKPGDAVLMNAFTLAPVPGAVAHAGAGMCWWKLRRILSLIWMISFARRRKQVPAIYCCHICEAISRICQD